MKRILLAASLATSVAIGSAQAEVNFAKDILPILRDNCIGCHGAEKSKGKLRLDTEAFAHKSAIVPGNLDDSELYQRVILPADDEDLMPPEDKGGPLKKEQIALLKQWVEEGGKYTGVDTISPASTQDSSASESAQEASNPQPPAFDYNSDIRPILDGLSPEQRSALMAWAAAGAPVPQLKAAAPQLVEAEVTEAESSAIEKLQEQGVLAMRLAQNVKWVQANFRLVGDKVTDDSLAPVSSIQNLTDLDLSKTAITDAGLAHIKGLTNLTRLNLNNTSVTDAGLQHLAGLKNLTYLNLYGTKVTDAGLESLKGIQTLEKLYLWQTGVTDAGAASIRQSLPWLYINRGIELATVAAPVEEKKQQPEPEVKEAPKAEAAPAAAEPKKEASAPAGPSIADVILFLSSNEASAVVPEASQVEAPSGPTIADVVLFLSSAESSPVPAAQETAAVTVNSGPSISEVLLFLNSESTATPGNSAAAASEELSIAEVLLQLN
ncbi:MAG: hypothetical protein LR011_11280 [Verrucomicrobia bacterium]|nr:hypothetical protein [Verrucomicrobiota bacterium]